MAAKLPASTAGATTCPVLHRQAGGEVPLLGKAPAASPSSSGKVLEGAVANGLRGARVDAGARAAAGVVHEVHNLLRVHLQRVQEHVPVHARAAGGRGQAAAAAGRPGGGRGEGGGSAGMMAVCTGQGCTSGRAERSISCPALSASQANVVSTLRRTCS